MSQAGATRTARPKKGKAAPVIILRNIPKGFSWGWFTREEPRMHLQTVDAKNLNRYKVWLETGGRRVIEAAADIPAKVLKGLQEEVIGLRSHIEGRWTNLMIANRWITWTMQGSEITLTAYPGFPGSRFSRTLDLAKFLPGIYDPTYPMTRKKPIRIDEIGLNEEMAAFEIWPQKHESERHHIFLPDILWQD